MPNHVHGIVWIADDHAQGATGVGAMGMGAMNRAPTADDRNVGARFIAPPLPRPNNYRPTLGEVIRTFKAVSTRSIRRNLIPEFGWQRNYHERIIRDDGELAAIRAYIRDNPGRWHEDAENPALLAILS